MNKITETVSPANEAHLNAQLALLRSEVASVGASPQLEATLRAAFAVKHRKQRMRDLTARWFAPGLSLAASVGMAAWITFAPVQQSVLEAAPTNTAFAGGGAFIAVQSLEQIALEPAPKLVETALPRMLLASYGVPINPESANESVRAQLLVSAGGQLLALRFAP